jgi:hypothetical protein
MPRITGRIVDDHNNPVENATITVPTEGVFALSDDHGNFEIEEVSTGNHVVFVVHRNFQKFAADLSMVGDLFVTFELVR